MKIAFHTLGCKVNQYETEALKEKFLNKGHEIVFEDDFADAYVINTCTVTSLADRKSRQYIRRMKKVNPLSIVAVTGCYVQIKPEEVASIDGVDIIAGTNEKNKLIEYVEEYCGEKEEHVLSYEELTEYEDMGQITSMESRTRAYIKIQEGCDKFCSYCIIPYARGPVRSRALEDIILEAKGLVEKGFKEIILTGINTALHSELAHVLANLEEMEGDFRVRLSSLEPTVINKDYVKKLLQYKKLCKHLHLSLQSGSNSILKAMNRNYNRKEYLDIVKVLRDSDSNYGITTDIIVGFPGEDEEAFQDTMDMVEKAEFAKVHGFKFSKREGTKAYDLPNQVNGTVKKERVTTLIEKGNVVSEAFYEKNLGTRRVVLFEEDVDNKRCVTGYTDNYIKVYADYDESLLNKLVEVKLEKLHKDGIYAII